MKLIVTENQGETIIPADMYEAKIKSYAAIDGNYGQCVRFDFEVSEGTYKGVTKNLLAALKVSRSSKGESKLLNLAQVVLGKSLGLHDEIDFDELVEKPCRIVLGEPVTKDGMQYQKVDKVLPSKL